MSATPGELRALQGDYPEWEIGHIRTLDGRGRLVAYPGNGYEALRRTPGGGMEILVAPDLPQLRGKLATETAAA